MLARVGKNDSYTDQVRETLLSAIATGVLRAGTLYSMQALADQMGVSRTPVREAMLQLQQQGVVRVMRNQGALILGRSAEELRQVFQIRRWLEVPAIREAASRIDEAGEQQLKQRFEQMRQAAADGDRTELERADRAFHATILRLSGNDRLEDMVGGIRDLVISQDQAAGDRERPLSEIVEQHTPILDALIARDPAAASAAMERHLELMAEWAIATAQDTPSASEQD